MMNPNELSQKTADELTRMVTELRAQIRDARFTISTRQNSKTRTLRDLKRDLARVLTALHHKLSTTV